MRCFAREDSTTRARRVVWRVVDVLPAHKNTGSTMNPNKKKDTLCLIPRFTPSQLIASYRKRPLYF